MVCYQHCPRAFMGFPQCLAFSKDANIFVRKTTTLHPTEATLPTLDKLGATVPLDLDVKKTAKEWFKSFASYVEAGNADEILSLLAEDAYWRDILAMTWNFRTFHGTSLIKSFLVDRLASTRLTALKLKDEYLELKQPYPDLAWIQGLFDFQTNIGFGSGVFRLVPQANGSWKGHCIFTNLEDLKGFPEKIGRLRNTEPSHGIWAQDRLREQEFADKDPTVLIIGGGQSGLELSARLKVLGVTSLVVEKNQRVGDNWRNRYEALCLHDPVYYDHMPYLPFPPTWPVFTPAGKLANWMESYAESLELNVWTSSTVIHASQDASKMWHVTVKRAGGAERVLKVKHLVFALGFKGGEGHIPTYAGMDIFKGQILHSSQHKKAADHAGKKVVVIGSCTSAHDICVDYYKNGVDVTMFQRSSTYIASTKNAMQMSMKGSYDEDAPPTDVVDRIQASFPSFLGFGLFYRLTKRVAEADKVILDGLRQRGFKLNMGYKDAGFVPLARTKAGGYYLDVGGSQLIIDGKIKLKNDSLIERFTETGLKFENGSELQADVVIFSTGLGDARQGVRKICGDDVADRCPPIWDLDEEGEVNGCYRDMGSPGLWYMMGNFAMCRFHSKHVALQIKAMEENVFGGRYNTKSSATRLSGSLFVMATSRRGINAQ